MSVLDKFLDAIRLNDDYDDEDEFFDDDIEDEYEDEKPKRRFFKKLNDGDLDENEEEYIKSVKKKTASVQSQPKNVQPKTDSGKAAAQAVSTENRRQKLHL